MRRDCIDQEAPSKEDHNSKCQISVGDKESAEDVGLFIEDFLQVEREIEVESEPCSEGSSEPEDRPQFSTKSRPENQKKKLNPWVEIVENAKEEFAKHWASKAKVTAPTAQEIDLLLNLANTQEPNDETPSTSEASTSTSDKKIQEKKGRGRPKKRKNECPIEGVLDNIPDLELIQLPINQVLTGVKAVRGTSESQVEKSEKSIEDDNGNEKRNSQAAA